MGRGGEKEGEDERERKREEPTSTVFGTNWTLLLSNQVCILSSIS
jgi:hypothetical protein